MTIIELADAIVASIAGAPAGSFTDTFTISRKIMPLVELKAMIPGETLVTVVPVSIDEEGEDRAAVMRTHTIDIGVQVKCAVDPEAEVAAFTYLVDSIAKYIRRRKLQTALAAHYINMGIAPIAAADHATQHRVLTSVLRLTYKVLE